MEIAKTYSRALSGIDSIQVTVEIHLSRGLPKFHIVGLPETAVKESRERVRSAILTNYFEFPMKRITVNLAPADLPKEGGRYDLAIAIGILTASGQVAMESLPYYEFSVNWPLPANCDQSAAYCPAPTPSTNPDGL